MAIQDSQPLSHDIINKILSDDTAMSPGYRPVPAFQLQGQELELQRALIDEIRRQRGQPTFK